MFYGQWESHPDGVLRRTIYFRSKREKYAYLLQQMHERELQAYINGAIAGRTITLNQINNAWKPRTQCRLPGA